jgi:hypothetical protein
MLRRNLFITLFLIPTLFSVAQNQVRTISGELIDQVFGGKADTEGRYDKKWGQRDQRRR